MDIITAAAISNIAIFFLYILSEYPKVTANIKQLNAAIVKFSQNAIIILYFFALLAAIGVRVIPLWKKDDETNPWPNKN